MNLHTWHTLKANSVFQSFYVLFLCIWPPGVLIWWIKIFYSILYLCVHLQIYSFNCYESQFISELRIFVNTFRYLYKTIYFMYFMWKRGERDIQPQKWKTNWKHHGKKQKPWQDLKTWVHNIENLDIRHVDIEPWTSQKLGVFSGAMNEKADLMLHMTMCKPI